MLQSLSTTNQQTSSQTEGKRARKRARPKKRRLRAFACSSYTHSCTYKPQRLLACQEECSTGAFIVILRREARNKWKIVGQLTQNVKIDLTFDGIADAVVGLALVDAAVMSAHVAHHERLVAVLSLGRGRKAIVAFAPHEFGLRISGGATLKGDGRARTHHDFAVRGFAAQRRRN